MSSFMSMTYYDNKVFLRKKILISWNKKLRRKKSSSKKTYIFLADKGLSPPLADDKNVRFLNDLMAEHIIT